MQTAKLLSVVMQTSKQVMHINERLSKNRAEAVATMLKEKGIDNQRITIDYKGDTVQPFATIEENRVSICIAE